MAFELGKFKEPKLILKLVELAICVIGVIFLNDSIMFGNTFTRHATILAMDVYCFILLVIIADYLFEEEQNITYCIFLIVGAILNIVVAILIFNWRSQGDRYTKALEVGIMALVLGCVMTGDAIYSIIER